MNNEASVFMLRKQADIIRSQQEDLSKILDLAADTIIRSKAALNDARTDAIIEIAEQVEMTGNKMLHTQPWVGIVILNNAAYVRSMAEIERNKYGDGNVGC